MNESPSNKRRNIIIGATVTAIVGLIVLAWHFRSSSKAAEEADESAVVVGVRTAKAERRSISAEVSAVGTIFPREQAIVSAGINGQIKKMRLLKNVVVKAGDTIAVLDARDLKAQREEAAAAL